MKTIYVCSPFRPVGPNPQKEMRENIEVAKRVCKQAVLQGHQVECPHLFFPRFLNDADISQRHLGMQLGLLKLESADEVWVVGNRISEGMSREIAKAGDLGIPVRCVADPLVAEEHLLNAILKNESEEIDDD